MKDTFSVSELQKSMKEALDLALSGKPVYIVRRYEKFKVVADTKSIERIKGAKYELPH